MRVLTYRYGQHVCACGCDGPPQLPTSRYIRGHRKRYPLTGFPFREGFHYELDPETGCWNWLRFQMRGYGRTGDPKKGGGFAHRYVYERMHDVDLPTDIEVHHTCENPSCVNPDHLQAVPKAEHVRAHRREASPFTVEDIVSIRERVAAGPRGTQRRIADEYGVHWVTISYIVNGKRWAEVGGPIRGQVAA